MQTLMRLKQDTYVASADTCEAKKDTYAAKADTYEV